MRGGIEFRQLVLLVVLLLALRQMIVAQEPSTDLSQKVDQLFSKYDKQDSPGCAVGIIRDGGIVYKRGYGMANLDFNIPNSPSTVFNVASMGKQFTAASIVLLAQRRKLSLDDDIRINLRAKSALASRQTLFNFRKVN